MFSMTCPLTACAMCGKQVEAAARLVWVDLALLAVPFAAIGAGIWLFTRELNRNSPEKGPPAR